MEQRINGSAHGVGPDGMARSVVYGAGISKGTQKARIHRDPASTGADDERAELNAKKKKRRGKRPSPPPGSRLPGTPHSPGKPLF